MVSKSAYSSLDVVDGAGYNGNDINELFERKQAATSRRRPRIFAVNDGWLLELLSLGTGCLLLAALCLVLNSYDYANTPYIGGPFGHAVTLNTIVAIIGVAIQAAFLFPIVECLGQLKWHWFLNARPLHDLLVFDRAGRGMMGALAFLLRMRFKSSASLGALLFVLALTLSPFSQQLVAIQTHRMPDANSNTTVSIIQKWVDQASGPQAHQISLTNDSPGSVAGPSAGLKSAALAGMYMQNDTMPALAPSCPSGDCTFDQYQSLAICASFANISDHIQYTNQSATSKQCSLASRSFLMIDSSNAGTALNVSSIAGNSSIAFADARGRLADIVMLSPNWNATANATYSCSAFEFILQWCIQNYTTTVQDGIANTTIANTFQQWPTGEVPNNFEWPSDDSQRQSYTVDSNSSSSLSQYLSGIFNGTVSYSGNSLVASSDAMRVMYEPFGYTPTNMSGLQAIPANMAMSMTSYMRQSGKSSIQDASTSSATGVVWKQTNVVVIRWKWISAAVIFAVLSIIFVGYTIFASRKLISVASWKSSDLALIYALDPELARESTGLTTVSELKARSESTRVRLAHSSEEGQWRLIASGQPRRI